MKYLKKSTGQLNCQVEQISSWTYVTADSLRCGVSMGLAAVPGVRRLAPKTPLTGVKGEAPPRERLCGVGVNIMPKYTSTQCILYCKNM